MSNENSLLEYETGVTFYPMGALTDSGDHLTFTSSAVRAILPSVSGANNSIDIAALTASIAGTDIVVSASVDTSITRPATNVASVISITVTSLGAIALITGTAGASTTFSETRGAAGGPPFIPVSSIEIGQVRLASSAAAVISQQEIFTIIGTHVERSDFPVFTVANETAEIHFSTALPAIHTGGNTKGVYASYGDPIFLEQTFANDFVPAETSFSTSSTQVYGATIGASSSSLGQGSFTAVLKDGITDNLIGKKGETLWFKYYQDRNKLPHILTQGKLGIGRTFGAANNPSVSCTISPEVESIDRAS